MDTDIIPNNFELAKENVKKAHDLIAELNAQASKWSGIVPKMALILSHMEGGYVIHALNMIEECILIAEFYQFEYSPHSQLLTARECMLAAKQQIDTHLGTKGAKP